LDAGLRGELRAELHRILKESSKTVLLVTHDRGEAFEMADRIGVLTEGRLQQTGTPESVHRRPCNDAVARLVCDGALLPARREGSAVSTELGPLPLDEAIAGSDELLALVRESAVTLVRDPDGEGIVERCVFRGSGNAVEVRLPSGAALRCGGDRGSDLQPGDRVRVRLDTREVLVVAKVTGPAIR
ncbi:MAG TPA: TOBE domain-containing protein, partial [Vicinamibacteria bacterium]